MSFVFLKIKYDLNIPSNGPFGEEGPESELQSASAEFGELNDEKSEEGEERKASFS